jgi:hypothetical protein
MTSRILAEIGYFGEPLVARLVSTRCASCWLITLTWPEEYAYDIPLLEATFRRHLLGRARLHLDEPTLIWARALPPFYNTNIATFLIGRPGDPISRTPVDHDAIVVLREQTPRGHGTRRIDP